MTVIRAVTALVIGIAFAFVADAAHKPESPLPEYNAPAEADNFADSFNSDDAFDSVAPESTWASEVELFQEPEPTPAKINKTAPPTLDAALTQAIGAMSKLKGHSKKLKKIQSMLSTLSGGNIHKHKTTKIQSVLSTILSTIKNDHHSQKLTNTITSKKTSLKTLMDSIIDTLKTEYSDHKSSAELEIAKLDTEEKAISNVEFGEVAAKAHEWCTKWEEQQDAKRLLTTKLQQQTAARDATVTVILNDAAAFDCSYTNSNGQPFSPERTQCPVSACPASTASFKTDWEAARTEYLQKNKAHYVANTAHTADITISNNAAAIFKGSISDLADAKVNQCQIGDKVTVLASVQAFNTANVKRASVCRTMEVIRCHVTNMEISKASKDIANSALETCTNDVGTEKHFQDSYFADVTIPSVVCPTRATYTTLIKNKHSLNLHFTGLKTDPATTSHGTVITSQGWYPSTAVCVDVEDKAQKCNDVSCPSGQKKRNGVANNPASHSDQCCQSKQCQDWSCATGNKKKDDVANNPASSQSAADTDCCISLVELVTDDQITWSDLKVHQGGGDVGAIHGLFGTSAPDVTGKVPVAGAFKMRVQLRYWALDTWDTGEAGKVYVDGVEKWTKPRSSASDCTGWSLYSGSANIPNLRNTKCYFDVDFEVLLNPYPFYSGMYKNKVEIDLKVAATTDQAASDESWGFSDVTMTLTPPCTWVYLGTPIAVSEIRVSNAPTKNSCENTVSAQQPTANGARWRPGNWFHMCFAEFGMTGTSSTNAHTHTCLFNR